jgi:hypothetical protein
MEVARIPALSLQVAFGGGEVVVDGGAADVHGVGYFVDGVAEMEDTAFAEQAGGALFVGAGKRAEPAADHRLNFGNGNVKCAGEMRAVGGRWSNTADTLTVPIEGNVGGPKAVGIDKRATEGMHDGAQRSQQFVSPFCDLEGWLHTHPQPGGTRSRCRSRQRPEQRMNVFGFGLHGRTERTILGGKASISHRLYCGEHVRTWPAFSKWFHRELKAQATHHALP